MALTNRHYTRSDGNTGTVHGISRHDASPVYRGGYDSRCGLCYLGATHTLHLHVERVREATR